jgi:predicted alpha/beta hydrolase family esterase
MKHALILHAWHNKPENHWYPWLKKELETKGYEVALPELPTMNTDLPDLAQQLKVAEKLVTKDTVVIGHSLGCLLAMRLAETHSYQKMILVAGWDFNDLTPEHRLFWQTLMNHAAIKKHVKEIYVISSDNDPYITAFLAEEMCKRLGGKFILIKGAGHFTKDYGITTIPALINLV